MWGWMLRNGCRLLHAAEYLAYLADWRQLHLPLLFVCASIGVALLSAGQRVPQHVCPVDVAPSVYVHLLLLLFRRRIRPAEALPHPSNAAAPAPPLLYVCWDRCCHVGSWAVASYNRCACERLVQPLSPAFPSLLASACLQSQMQVGAREHVGSHVLNREEDCGARAAKRQQGKTERRLDRCWPAVLCACAGAPPRVSLLEPRSPTPPNK